MPTMRSLQFSTNCTATHLNEDPHDILQTRFVKTLFSNFDNFSHIAPEQGLSWGLLNYEADLRGEGQGLLALARNKNRANLPRKMFKPVLILEKNLLRKVVHNGDSFGWLLIQEWILVLQSFRESSFSGKPASFVTKVAVFYWQACKVSGGGNSATELKPNVKKWKSFLGQDCNVSGGEFCQGMLVVTECESVFIWRTSGFLEGKFCHKSLVVVTETKCEKFCTWREG